MLAILHNVRSMHNVGSIMRTADAVGIQKLYLSGITPAPIDRFGNPRPQISKVSLGAEKYIAWEKKYSTLKVLKQLKDQGYKILAIEQSEKAVPYVRFDPLSISPFIRGRKRGGSLKTALVVGNEIKGLPKKILDLTDQILEIPMYGKKESLNVAVAFGIVAYHLKMAKALD